MTRLIRIELLKLRTTRATYGMLAGAAALTAVMTALDSARAGGEFLPPLDTSTGLGFVLTITGFALLMALICGIMVSSGEFRHATATTTYLATPQRGRVLIAKLVAGAITGLAFGLAGAVATTVVGLAFVAAHGYPIAVSTGTILRDAAGAMLGAAMLGAVGVALGTLIRSQLAAVIGAFAWALIVESILGGAFGSAGPYLPYTAATTIAGSRLGGGDIGFAGTPDTTPLPVAGAVVLVLGLALLLAIVAERTTLRRDIT